MTCFVAPLFCRVLMGLIFWQRKKSRSVLTRERNFPNLATRKKLQAKGLFWWRNSYVGVRVGQGEFTPPTSASHTVSPLLNTPPLLQCEPLPHFHLCLRAPYLGGEADTQIGNISQIALHYFCRRRCRPPPSSRQRIGGQWELRLVPHHLPPSPPERSWTSRR